MKTLFVNEKPLSQLKFLPGKSAPEHYAAAELRKYLASLAGVSEGGDYEVRLTIDPAIENDGYRIRIDDGGMDIRGGNGRGVIYAVYGLLEHFAGMHFYMPGLEVADEGDIHLAGSLDYTPVFEYRRSDWQCGNDVDWSVKNCVNSREIPDEMGGFIKYSALAHTMTKLTGVPHDKQPCLSDPAVLETAKKNARAILEADPKITILSVTQNDNFNYCRCEKCAATDAEEGSPAGTLLRFVNAIADDLKDDYPHITVDTFAYQYTRKPPKITRPRPNVCVRLCSIECCFSHRLDDPGCERNRAFVEDIKGWNQICDNLYIWDYTTNYTYYVTPFPDFGVLRDNMRFFADHSGRGMYPEGNHNAPFSGEFGELRCYLLARLMRDPYMSEAEYYAHMDGFLKAYYGAGWRNLRAYIDITTGEAKNAHMGIFGSTFRTIPKQVWLDLEPVLDALWAAAERDAGDRVEYVRRSALQWKFIKLNLHPGEEAGRAFLDELLARNIRFSEWKTIDPAVKIPDLSTPPDEWFHQI